MSYFNLLDLVEFLMHAYITSFPFHFLMWQSWVCANTVAHLCLQYVHHLELRHYVAVQADRSQRLTQDRICSVPVQD